MSKVTDIESMGFNFGSDNNAQKSESLEAEESQVEEKYFQDVRVHNLEYQSPQSFHHHVTQWEIQCVLCPVEPRYLEYALCMDPQETAVCQYR